MSTTGCLPCQKGRAGLAVSAPQATPVKAGLTVSAPRAAVAAVPKAALPRAPVPRAGGERKAGGLFQGIAQTDPLVLRPGQDPSEAISALIARLAGGDNHGASSCDTKCDTDCSPCGPLVSSVCANLPAATSCEVELKFLLNETICYVVGLIPTGSTTSPFISIAQVLQALYFSLYGSVDPRAGIPRCPISGCVSITFPLCFSLASADFGSAIHILIYLLRISEYLGLTQTGGSGIPPGCLTAPAGDALCAFQQLVTALAAAASSYFGTLCPLICLTGSAPVAGRAGVTESKAAKKAGCAADNGDFMAYLQRAGLGRAGTNAVAPAPADTGAPVRAPPIPAFAEEKQDAGQSHRPGPAPKALALALDATVSGTVQDLAEPVVLDTKALKARQKAEEKAAKDQAARDKPAQTAGRFTNIFRRKAAPAPVQTQAVA